MKKAAVKDLHITVHEEFPFRVVKVNKGWYEIHDKQRRYYVIHLAGGSVQDNAALSTAKDKCKSLQEAYRRGENDRL